MNPGALKSLTRLALALGLGASAAVDSAAADDYGRWYWFANCGGPTVTLEVRFERRVLHTETIPTCRARGDSEAAKGQEKRISFTFLAERAMTWTGYLASGESLESPASAMLTVDIWEAGADPDAMLLGVTVMGERQIYMNTGFAVRPGEQSILGLGKDMVVIVRPVGAVPIEGKLRAGKMASTVRVRSDPALLDDFITNILELDPHGLVFISDRSTINDFAGRANPTLIRQRIKERYGVVIDESGPILVADILDRIKRKRGS
jgi:hypothetical protein